MKILIATDGSDYSKAAIEAACEDLVRPESSEILVVSAFEDAPPITAEPFAISAEYYQKIEQAVMDQCKTFVEEAREIIENHFGSVKVSLATEILRGSPDHQIVEKAKEWGADVIVVGSHGRGFWGRLLGSVSDGVVHHAPCSVFVVRK
ncbi:MAG: universal stress protein [Chloracidobacterium sp.]|nr:universal stress protein [Chloracidobacterium sp.]